MSVNCLLGKDHRGNYFPVPLVDEVFVVKRAGVNFSVCNSVKSYSGKGSTILTNKRLVFLKDGPPEKHKVFSCLELPLHLVHGKAQNSLPEFVQPILSANYLQGSVDPMDTAETPLQSTSTWKLVLTNGGCNVFISTFFTVYKLSMLRSPSPRNTLIDDLRTQSESVIREQFAFYDPGDPTVIYYSQPVLAGQPG